MWPQDPTSKTSLYFLDGSPQTSAGVSKPKGNQLHCGVIFPTVDTENGIIPISDAKKYCFSLHLKNIDRKVEEAPAGRGFWPLHISKYLKRFFLMVVYFLMNISKDKENYLKKKTTHTKNYGLARKQLFLPNLSSGEWVPKSKTLKFLFFFFNTDRPHENLFH